MSVTPDTGETPSDNRDFILPSLERFGLTTKVSKVEALGMYGFCELTASRWRSKPSPSLPLLGKYSTHCVQLSAGHWRIPSAKGAGRGVAVVPSHSQVYSPVHLAEAGRPWQARAGREAWGTRFPSWL